MRPAGSNKPTRARSVHDWTTWCEKVDPVVAAFARQWVNAMEEAVGGRRGGPVHLCAYTTLRAAGGGSLHKSDVEEVVGVLADVWVYGRPLLHWAGRQGYTALRRAS